jgi:Tfp pilus assembly protein PilO
MKLILPISFLAIVGVLFFFVIDPIYKDVRQLKSDVSTYNVALDNSTELQKTRDSLIETYKNIKKEDKERLNHFLPSTINNIELILEIEKIASLHGMPIKDIKFDSMNVGAKDTTVPASKDKDVVVAEANPKDYLPYGIFPISFSVDGDYNTFVAFLTDLERNLRLVDIKSISFTVPSPSQNAGGSTQGGNVNQTNPNIFSYSLKVETYWLK